MGSYREMLLETIEKDKERAKFRAMEWKRRSTHKGCFFANTTSSQALILLVLYPKVCV
jgi:hypothetical protein